MQVFLTTLKLVTIYEAIQPATETTYREIPKYKPQSWGTILQAEKRSNNYNK